MTETAISMCVRVCICAREAFKRYESRSPSRELCSLKKKKKKVTALVSFRQIRGRDVSVQHYECFQLEDFGVIKNVWILSGVLHKYND